MRLAFDLSRSDWTVVVRLKALWDRCDRPAILAADGSGEREDVIGELTAGAERLLALAAEQEC
jgi:hypothetical protein